MVTAMLDVMPCSTVDITATALWDVTPCSVIDR